MRRYTFYIFIALLTFGTGFFSVLKFIEKPKEMVQYSQIKQIPQVPHDFSTDDEPINAEVDEKGSLLCTDKNILPIWNKLKKDEIFKSWTEKPYIESDCGKILEIKRADLNNDGIKEFIIAGKKSNLCGATGNCAFWIFLKNGDEYRKLLADVSDQEELKNEMPLDPIQQTKTNGYFDILIRTNFSGGAISFQYYKFDGLKYSKSKCLMEQDYINDRKKVFSCREWEKLQAENRQAEEIFKKKSSEELLKKKPLK